MRNVRDLSWHLTAILAILAVFTGFPSVCADDSHLGPWGVLAVHETILEPPVSYLWDDLFTEQTIWEFEGSDQAAAESFLTECGFGEDLIKLAREGVWNVSPAGLTLEPPTALLAQMTRAQRTQLYARLPNHPASQRQRLTCTIEGGDLRALAGDLPPRMLDLAESLTYRRGQTQRLSDLPYLMSQAADPALKRTILQAVSRTRALTAYLVIDEDTDIDAAARYWAKGSDYRRVASLIASVQNTEGGGKLDIANLLPPMPRRYLNSYVRLEDAVGGDLPDCLWAAFNFFRPDPSQRILGSTLGLQSYLSASFDRVETPYELGDLFIVTGKESGAFVHAYSYVADDIVFTKNGHNPLKPCTLMRYENMIGIYRETAELETVAYRRKSAS